MKARRFVESALVIAVMTVAFGAAGAGTASAQEPDPPPFPPFCPFEEGCPSCPPCETEECPPCAIPPTCVDTSDPDGESGPLPSSCSSEIALFTPENDSWTYVFDPNNSMKITTTVNSPFFLKVDRTPMTQTEFDVRTTGTPFSEAICWRTLGECVYYRVHGETVPRDFYGQNVEYIVGFLTPPIKGNKHDWMLLRDPHSRFLGDPETPFLDDRFCQEITTKVNRHYIVPGQSVPDPGVGGVALGMSDYIVAHQRLRPASSKKRAEGQCPEPLPTGPPGG